jgi:hypothetical protein
VKEQPSKHWRDQSACRDADPRLFFLDEHEKETPGRFDEAKALCDSCPVKQFCKKGADRRKEKWGFWHGRLREKVQVDESV